MIPAPIEDAGLVRRIASLPPDGMTVFTLGRGRVRGALLHGTRMVNQMRANHGLGPLETLVLGRAYLCAGLLCATIKGEDGLALRVDGDGPAEGFSVEAKAEGAVRGYLFKSPIFPDAPSEAIDTSRLFGRGGLTMTRFSGDRGRPYTGTIALRTGRLAQDLAVYYMESEQTRTAFDASIHFDREGRSMGAGALFFQALPGSDDGFLTEVEDCLGSLPSIGLWFAEGGTRDRFIDQLLKELSPQRMGEKAVSFSCDCSKARFGSFLGSASRELLVDLIEKGPWPTETLCHNCGSAYYFDRVELETMLASARPL